MVKRFRDAAAVAIRSGFDNAEDWKRVLASYRNTMHPWTVSKRVPYRDT